MRYRLEAFAYDLIRFILCLFPFSWISGFGAALVKLIGPLTSKQHIARTGLKIAFPDADEAKIKALLKAQWDNIGRTFAEFPLTHRLKPFSKNSRVEIIGLDIFLSLIHI